MPLHPGRLIGEIAATVPGAIEALASAGIDCCRDAGLTIEEVSLRTGIRPGHILSQLRACGRQQTPATDWVAEPLTALTRYVTETLHPAETAAMERISQHLAIEQQDHPSDVTVGKLRSAFAELANNLMIHMWREDNEVFPFIEDLEKRQGAAPPPVRGAFPDPHDPILEALRRLRAMTRGYTAPAIPRSMAPVLAELRAFDDMIHRHVHLENHVLHPRASALCACPLEGSDAAGALIWF
jgi:regulator of cell morphogenesis and NO signaling